MAQRPDSVRLTRWHADLTYLGAELPKRHIKPWAHVLASTFASEVTRLDGDLAKLSDADIQLRMVRLVAMLSDGHSGMPLPMYSTRLPVSLYWFDTGPHIIQAPAEYAYLLGARIVGVGGHAMDAVRDTLTQYFSHENEMGARNGLPDVLLRPALLRSAGLIRDSTSVDLEVELRSGERRQVALPAVPGATYSAGPRRDTLPLYQQRSREKYWFAWLPESRTVYLKYNQCKDAPQFQRMTDSVAHLIDSVGAARLVVDVRNNGGGDSRVLMPLLAAVRARDHINRKNALYLIMGRQTFSSGLMAAWEFRHKTHATLIGEPAGERSDNYGEVRTFNLPNSGIMVWHSTKHFQMGGGDAEQYAPDFTVPPTIDAVLSGRDVALEWILRDVRK